jgi:hypothetical protein
VRRDALHAGDGAAAEGVVCPSPIVGSNARAVASWSAMKELCPRCRPRLRATALEGSARGDDRVVGAVEVARRAQGVANEGLMF